MPLQRADRRQLWRSGFEIAWSAGHVLYGLFLGLLRNGWNDDTFRPIRGARLWLQALVSVHSSSGLHPRLTNDPDGVDLGGDGEAGAWVPLLHLDAHAVRDSSSWRE